jgi:hypothetical protein
MSLSLLFGDQSGSSDFNGDTYLKWLSERLGGTRIKPPMQPNDPIRASGIGWMCMREEVLRAKLLIPKETVNNANDDWTMGLGTALHYVLQNEILGPVGELIGDWRCLGCGQLMEDTTMPSERHSCQKWESDGSGWFYVEKTFVMDPGGLNIRGHIDGIHPSGDVWEFKSANPYAMKNIRQGVIYPAYVDQVHVYMAAVKAVQTRFMFIDKGGAGMKSIFPVVVKYDPSIWDDIEKRVVQLREGLSGGKLPQRICANRECSRAKGCPVVAECFAATG